ncbi:hypothetical protein EGW08_000079 [Elysia chlorotica]|uniref:Major facilitator superfamily (MFS) profile domain-containing protein n=1 Tax=Elysia chlorotica TaxID=188477 RepID=A0A3S1A1T7_ELYCH|nr:hypothetical protein EGW08_000079 [Elysia chlorotica]
MLFLGQGIGAYLTSYFSDRFGRKTIIVASNFGLLVCGLIVAFAPDPIIFMIFKVLIGGFQQAEQAVWAPGLIIGTCTCFVCLLVSFLPETSGRELPQTISELQAWFV